MEGPATEETPPAGAPETSPPIRREYAWLAAVLLLALVLRLYRLGFYDYWQDEVFNLMKGIHIKEVFLEGNFVSNHPPLFGLLVALWQRIGLTANEWTTRALPMLLGMATVFAVYVTGKRFFNARAGLIAAFLVALSPYHIYQAQELKVYILVPLTCTLAMLALHEAAKTNRRAWWAAYTFAAASACYSDFYAGPLLLTANLWFLFGLAGRRDRLRPWFVANTVGALLFVPQLALMYAKAASIMVELSAWWVPRPDIMSVLFYIKTMAFGYGHFDLPFKIAMAFFVAAVAGGSYVALRRYPRSAWLALMWLLLPAAMIFAISQVSQSVFLIRSLIPYSIPFYLLGALGIGSLPRPRWRQAALAAALLLAAPSYYAYTHNIFSPQEWPHRPGVRPRHPYAQATKHILDNWREGDIVIHPTGDPSYFPFYWYGLRGKPQYRADVDEEFINYFYDAHPITTRHPHFDAYYVEQLQPIVEGKQRVWFVFNEWERANLPGYPTGVWRWMDSHFHQIGYKDFEWFEIFLYANAVDDEPIEWIERDQDDGVTAAHRYRGGFEGGFLHRLPENELYPRPLDERRGRLRLAFAEAEAAQAKPIEEAVPGRTVAFAIENVSDEVVTAFIDCRASEILIEAASLYEERPGPIARSDAVPPPDPDPASEVWHVTPLHRPGKMPEAYEGLRAAVAHFTPAEAATLLGTAAIDQGSYEVSLYSPWIPGDIATARAFLELEIAGQTLLDGSRPSWETLPGWQWRSLGQIEISQDGNADVRLTALPNPDVPESWADVAYILLRRGSGAGAPAWPREVKLAPGENRQWHVAVPADARRVDIWVYGQGPSGKAYRIFRVFDGKAE